MVRGSVLRGVDGAPSAWLAARAAAALSARPGEGVRSIAVGADATGLADVELACALSRSALQIAPRPVMTEPATSGTGEVA